MALPPWVHVADAATLGARLVAAVTPIAEDAVQRRGAWSLAIPGGSVVELLLPTLVQAPLPWDRAHLFWCDERVVPPGDSQSNWEALRRLGATFARLNVATLHRMATVGSYAAEVEQMAGRPPVLDVVLLGTGEDGHVASLFPGRPALDERSATVVVEEAAPKPPPRRLSLSMPVLVNASITVVAAFGAGKSDAVRAALTESSDLPLARVLREARRPLLLLDEAAAALLR
jgi:6-phosphogluconolactonase